MQSKPISRAVFMITSRGVEDTLFYFDNSFHDREQGISDMQEAIGISDGWIAAVYQLGGEKDASVKLTCLDLHIVIAERAIGGRESPFARDADIFIRGGDADGLLFHPCQIDYDNPLLISLIDVTLGMPDIIDGIFYGSRIMSERIYFSQYLEHFPADTQQIIIDFIVHRGAPAQL
jgi:hypothetical protein